MKYTLLDIMTISTVIPVITINNSKQAVPLAKALIKGNIRVLEITLRTTYGLSAIRDIVNKVPKAIVGVGTLTHPNQFKIARDAGAVFGVSPGLTQALIAASKSSGLPLLPGVMTPSEIMIARDAGFYQLKLFPAILAGGIAMLNAISGPLGDVTFCPTGGISQETAAQFLACKNVTCVGGSWLTPNSIIKNSDWEKITILAKIASKLKKTN